MGRLAAGATWKIMRERHPLAMLDTPVSVTFEQFERLSDLRRVDAKPTRAASVILSQEDTSSDSRRPTLTRAERTA